MKRPLIAIVCRDTLRSEGLRRLLGIISDALVTDASPSSPPDTEPCLWITDTEAVVEHSAFFAPRRKTTAVITTTPSDSFLTVNPSLGSDELLERMQEILASLPAPAAEQSALSQREIDVLRLLARGCINKEIADRLSISINTVLTHRKNITAKLGIKSISGLGIYAVMNGYVSENDI
ncbi:MAG: LuxR C-terminal-related transcriptional regulator [Duncaniella sp.]|nr:LuxR C-terminal-related transcriptional regulator [Duncaniella sp.]